MSHNVGNSIAEKRELLLIHSAGFLLYFDPALVKTMAFGKIIQSESLINFAVWLDRIQSRDRYPGQRHNNHESEK